MVRINGTARADSIRGRGTPDIMHGYEGNDALAGAYGDDVVYGDYGDDALWGDNGRDLLFGGAGDDVLRGGWGADRLQGGPGNDWYIGGPVEARDRFVFSHVAARGYTTENVMDFDLNDVLDFSEIDADWTRPGNQAFRRVGDSFSGEAGELIFSYDGSGTGQYTSYYLDVDGNAVADMVVYVHGGWYDLNPDHGQIVY